MNDELEQVQSTPSDSEAASVIASDEVAESTELFESELVASVTPAKSALSSMAATPCTKLQLDACSPFAFRTPTMTGTVGTAVASPDLAIATQEADGLLADEELPFMVDLASPKRPSGVNAVSINGNVTSQLAMSFLTPAKSAATPFSRRVSTIAMRSPFVPKGTPKPVTQDAEDDDLTELGKFKQ